MFVFSAGPRCIDADAGVGGRGEGIHYPGSFLPGKAPGRRNFGAVLLRFPQPPDRAINELKTGDND